MNVRAKETTLRFYKERLLCVLACFNSPENTEPEDLITDIHPPLAAK